MCNQCTCNEEEITDNQQIIESAGVESQKAHIVCDQYYETYLPDMFHSITHCLQLMYGNYRSIRDFRTLTTMSTNRQKHYNAS